MNHKEYSPQEIEPKWQEIWEKDKIYQTNINVGAGSSRPEDKYYVLDMFPYPSGEGLHVGHPKGYVYTDIVARYHRMLGKEVLHPMGLDSFGSPAENYAIKKGIHPSEVIDQNSARFYKQLEMFGFSYDWSRKIRTSDPEYYKWTQWIFLKLFENDLAYEAELPINWCPSCKTGIANEEVVKGECERCGSKVTKKKIRQWVLKIREYADRLLEDLDGLDWPEPIKEMQRNWIGRSEGANVKFQVSSVKDQVIEVYTTRPDTLFGATFMCLAPENELINKIVTDDQKEEVNKYIEEALNKSEVERQENKDKTGVFTGAYAVNPVNDEQIPIWVADYVLADYGSGAIMCVPGHDERDFDFATKYDLPIIEVVRPLEGEPRDDAEHRDTVTAIVQRKSDGKILIVNWKKTGWVSPPIGGIDEGETPEQAAERELLEETGYQAKAVKKLGGQIESHFYADHKKVWRSRLDQPVLLELVDEDPKTRSDEEKNILEPVWMEPTEAINKITHSYNTIGIKILLGIEKCFTGEGRAINSGFIDGLTTPEAKAKMINWLEEKDLGHKKVDYKIRDWLFSRQRYWGEPIPLVHCDQCGIVPVPYEELPLELPKVENYQPSDSGESPLANIEGWVNTECPKCGGPAKRETNTMPQWAGSCWYYLRFIDPHNDKELADPEKLKKWLPVDFYVGGAEHAVLHLLYARFWHKFLYDIKVVPTKEPFQKLQNVGMVQAEDGTKMSKSKGNVVNPDEMINQYGADTFRAYEMFMGPFSDAIAWDTKGMQGVHRFLNKVWNLAQEIILVNEKIQETPEQWLYMSDEIKEVELATLVNKNIKKITEQYENLSLNTAVSHLMIFVNDLQSLKNKFDPARDPIAWRQALEALLLIIAPLCPHVAEELWQEMGHTRSVVLMSWPQYNPKLVKEETIVVPIQINGKRRAEIVVPADIDQEEIISLAKEQELVKKHLEGKNVAKEIYVPGKIINIVIK